MYQQFYGLKEEPFSITPDPRYIYFSPRHREAFDLLTYAISHRRGFIELSGEVGAGKTTLIRALDDEFKKNPIGFFRTIVMPLLPREAKLSLDHDGVLEWKSMLGSLPATAEAQPTGQVIDVPAVDSGRGDE